jgi:transcriptional regulator NrdR family protein
MECPYCHKKQTKGEDKVLNTWEAPDQVNTYRRRKCNHCQKIFRTIEEVDPAGTIPKLTVKVH